MAFWSKVKGFLGRVGGGIKKGWNWLAGHKDKVLNAANQVADTVANVTGDTRAKEALDKYTPVANDIISKGDRIKNMISGLHV